MMLFNNFKKGQALPLNTIVIAILVIIVLLVIILFFTNSFSDSANDVDEAKKIGLACENYGGSCSSSCEGRSELSGFFCSDEKLNTCCKNGDESVSRDIVPIPLGGQ